MAQHATEFGKRPIAGTKPGGSENDPNEPNFSSLTPDIVPRNDARVVGLSVPPLKSGTGQPQPADLLARKGEAGPALYVAPRTEWSGGPAPAAEGPEEELNRLRSELSRLQTALYERDTELSRLVGAKEQADAARTQAQELQHMRSQLAQLQATLANHQTALARVNMSSEQSRQAWAREAQATLQRAEQTWKQAEIERLAAAEAQWRRQSESPRDDGAPRREVAGYRPPRAPTETVNLRGERISKEFSAVQDSRAVRETEDEKHHAPKLFRLLIGGACLAVFIIVAYPRLEPALPQSLRLNFLPVATVPAPVPHAATVPLRPVAPAPAPTPVAQKPAVAPPLAAPPQAAAVVPPQPPVAVNPTVAPPPSVAAKPAGVPQQPAPAKPAAETKPRLATIIRDVDMHVSPSASAPVFWSLSTGTKVAVIERVGVWARVETQAAGRMPRRQGWVSASFVKDDLVADKKAPATKSK